jgi:hypothetical protein
MMRQDVNTPEGPFESALNSISWLHVIGALLVLIYVGFSEVIRHLKRRLRL